MIMKRYESVQQDDHDDKRNRYTVNPSRYEDDTESSPPVYSQLVEQLKEAGQNSKNPALVPLLATDVLCGSGLTGVCLILYTILPLSCIVIGSIYFDQCSIQKFIPIWLIVIGAVGTANSLLKAISNLVNFARGETSGKGKPIFLRVIDSFTCLSGCFMFAWLITGSVWVYSIHQTVQHANYRAVNYCNYTIYYFAFGVITAYWGLLGLICLCIAVGTILGCLGFRQLVKQKSRPSNV